MTDSNITKSIEELVKAQILQAFEKDKDLIFNKVIDAILNEKVDEHGTKRDYDHHNKYTIIDVEIRKAIKNAAKEAVREFIAEKSTDIKTEIKKRLASDDNSLVNLIFRGIDSSFEAQWRFNVDIHPVKIDIDNDNQT